MNCALLGSMWKSSVPQSKELWKTVDEPNVASLREYVCTRRSAVSRLAVVAVSRYLTWNGLTSSHGAHRDRTNCAFYVYIIEISNESVDFLRFSVKTVPCAFLVRCLVMWTSLRRITRNIVSRVFNRYYTEWNTLVKPPPRIYWKKILLYAPKRIKLRLS